MHKISWPADLTPLLASRSGFTLQFYFFEVKVYKYLGKVRKIQVTSSSSFCWRAYQKSGGQYCPPPLFGPDRVKIAYKNIFIFAIFAIKKNKKNIFEYFFLKLHQIYGHSYPPDSLLPVNGGRFMWAGRG